MGIKVIKDPFKKPKRKKDNRVTFTLGNSIRNAIYNFGGVKAVEDASKRMKRYIPASTLYKYLNGSNKILLRKAHNLATILGLKAIFINGVFELEEIQKPLKFNKDEEKIVKIIPNYCSNCGNDLRG